MPAAPLTRGRLTALWHLLQTLEKLGGRAEIGDLMAYARRSSLRGGGLPLSDGAKLARQGRFIQERGGTVDLSSLGRRAIVLSTEDEPPAEVIRLFLSVLVLAEPPTWVAWWQGAPQDLDRVIPPGERQVLDDCGLLPTPSPDDPTAWAWWEALARVPLPEQRAVERKVVGNAGEELTVEFERRRLVTEGYPELANRVRWVAQESDAYGFDVASFAGDTTGGLDPESHVAIEVKSTTLPLTGVFRLFLTEHEWRTASGIGERYRLHLWGRVHPGPPPSSAQPAPLILRANVLTDHLPQPATCGDACRWQSAEVLLPVGTAT